MGELTCGQEWEVNVMERLAEISETDLLDLAQGIAALLTGDLTQAKTAALSGQAMTAGRSKHAAVPDRPDGCDAGCAAAALWRCRCA